MGHSATGVWSAEHRHDVFPEVCHDEAARFNFLAAMNMHLSQQVVPGLETAFEVSAKPTFAAAHGHAPASRHEVRQAMERNSYYQMWSALRRNTMEMRQQAGRSIVLRQLDAINARVAQANAADDGLVLNAAVTVPPYASAVDIHCMPGGYHGELMPGDVSAAANYDCGIFVTTAGLLGLNSDGGGRALVDWVQSQADFVPRRILDVGCTVGHNIVPLALALPAADVVAIDVAAPMLRYAHARARSLGASNIRFLQANAEQLDFPDGHFDLILTTMFLHETSARALPRILAETYRLLAPGGKVVHIEQPQYTDAMPLFEQFLRDWDTYNNNEPFWGAMHDIDLYALLARAGFSRDAVTTAYLQTSEQAARGEVAEDYGRAPRWHAWIVSKPVEASV
jgi:ubiquinone/menaquinone biosynthesis C-methylase UbiE